MPVSYTHLDVYKRQLLFNTSKEEYEARAPIVEAAYIYKGCAIALSDELEAGMNVVLPMAANDPVSYTHLALANRRRTPSATVCSVAVKPGRSALVESASSASTPLRPYSAIVGRSVTASPDSGCLLYTSRCV